MAASRSRIYRSDQSVAAACLAALAGTAGNASRGITLLSRALGGKRLELLKEAVPKVVRVAVLYEPAATGSAIELKEALPVARAR